MKTCLPVTALLVVVLAFPIASAGQDPHWPSFRGYHARGVAEGHPTPVRWNLADSENVRWRTSIPGLAHSSPVIWGDALFVTTAESEANADRLRVGLYGDIEPVQGDGSQRWRVYRLDKRTGAIVWERTAHEGVPRIMRHPKSTHANPTPATDGRHLVAYFGSEGLYCYDMNGELLWKKDFGILDAGFFEVPEAQWGVASSPVIHDGVVYLQADVQKGSFLAAFDVATGVERWRVPREDVPTWSTPTLHNTDRGPLLFVNGWKHIGGYDAKTGRAIWKLEGGGDIPVPTPVVGVELVFITNAHGGPSPIYAVRVDAEGDLTPESDGVAWSIPRGGAYMQTPLLYGDLLYSCRDNGVLSVFRAETGERLYQERLGGGTSGFSASPVAADGKIYFTSEEGDVYVLRAGERFELLGTSSLDEVTMATPAISEGVLYFRTRGHVIAIGLSEAKPGVRGLP